MGLLSGVLLFPVAAPVWGIGMLANRLAEEAQGMCFDETQGYAELLELSMRRNAGEITEEEYALLEAELFDELGALRESRFDEAGDEPDLVEEVE